MTKWCNSVLIHVQNSSFLTRNYGHAFSIFMKKEFCSRTEIDLNFSHGISFVFTPDLCGETEYINS